MLRWLGFHRQLLSSDGYFLDGCSLDACFLDGCFLDGCFLDGYFFDDCFLDGWLFLTFRCSSQKGVSSPFEVEFYPEPQSFHRTNLPQLFQIFVSLFEVEFYPEPQYCYRTNLLRPFTFFSISNWFWTIILKVTYTDSLPSQPLSYRGLQLIMK